MALAARKPSCQSPVASSQYMGDEGTSLVFVLYSWGDEGTSLVFVLYS